MWFWAQNLEPLAQHGPKPRTLSPRVPKTLNPKLNNQGSRLKLRVDGSRLTRTKTPRSCKRSNKLPKWSQKGSRIRTSSQSKMRSIKYLLQVRHYTIVMCLLAPVKTLLKHIRSAPRSRRTSRPSTIRVVAPSDTLYAKVWASPHLAKASGSLWAM